MHNVMFVTAVIWNKNVYTKEPILKFMARCQNTDHGNYCKASTKPDFSFLINYKVHWLVKHTPAVYFW